MSSPRVVAILSTLEHEPGLTVPEIAARTGHGTRLIHTLLWRLENDGKAVHEGNRWYVLSTAGPSTDGPASFDGDAA